MKAKKVLALLLQVMIILGIVGVFPASAAQTREVSSQSITNLAAAQAFKSPKPKFTEAVAFDKTPALRDIARVAARQAAVSDPEAEPVDIRPERGPVAMDTGYAGDGALQGASALRSLQVAPSAATSLGTIANFEGISNQDNFNIFGFRVNPPDPVGDVGPNHYVEMVNLAFAVYSKTGDLLLGPVDTGTLWANFPVEDCTDPSGDPIVLYDQLEDRWLLSQFTTRGPMYYDCVAISESGDPTGAYYRYAFVTQPDPDLPGGVHDHIPDVLLLVQLPE
jgi:hypothetical protein